MTTPPAEKYFAAQSLDNQILVYSTDNFRQARNKRFAGHSVAGYACQVGFSPDGKWISSGDGEGNVVFWEWKTGRIKSRLRAHSKVVIAHEWLPHETVRPCLPRAFCAVLAWRADAVSPFASFYLQSKVVTGSWDGLIKLWVRRARRFAARQERTDLTFACAGLMDSACVYPISPSVDVYNNIRRALLYPHLETGPLGQPQCGRTNVA